MNLGKINAYIEQTIELNPRRYEAIQKKIGELDKFVQESDIISKGMVQGSFATETTIKPLKDDELYDLDYVVLINEKVKVNDTSAFDPFKEKVKSAFVDFAKRNNFPEFKVNDKKYGFEIKFNSDLKIDLVILFQSPDDKTYLVDFRQNKNHKAKFDSPFLLTDALVRANDETKTLLIQLIKHIKRMEFTNFRDLDILPSIGLSILTIYSTNEYSFDWKNITKLLKDIIDTKNSRLYNPFNTDEEFFGNKLSDWSANARKYLMALDSIRLTILKAVKEDNEQIILDLLEKGTAIPSNGIDENPSGAGGHA